MENPFRTKEKVVHYFKLGEIFDRSAKMKLAEFVDQKKLKKLLERRLDTDEAREAYSERFLKLIADGLDNEEKEKIIVGLVGIAGGVTSLTASAPWEGPWRTTKSQDVYEFKKGSNLKYWVGVGVATGGQRILIPSHSVDGAQSSRLLLFPSQGEGISGDYQRAFQLLLGQRARNISRPQDDPYLVASVIENNSEKCPCRSQKPYLQCHGA